MTVLFLTNNNITTPLAKWLKHEAGEEVILCSEKLTLQYVENLNPELAISYNYRYIISEDIVSFMEGKIINLHISLLPHNRGAHPNLWSFINNTPKGVTIHLIDKGIDTGDILLQKGVALDEHSETLESSYKCLHHEIQRLFIANWDKIKNFQIPPKLQSEGGSLNYVKDSAKIMEIFGDKVFSTPIYELKQKLKELEIV
ncbi:MAG: formyltransferase family protein [Planctomycetota bacterium]|jgi:methionyl-tRNA formyltransferase